MKLERYWPQAAEVDACIKNEAETADVAVLLAVHQPSLLVTRNAGTLHETPATETDLLSAFLTEHVPGGALILPITGPSGVGKSHMIRWLDAQLRRCPQRDKSRASACPSCSPAAQASSFARQVSNVRSSAGSVGSNGVGPGAAGSLGSGM